MSGQLDGLIAAQVGRLPDGAQIDPPELQVRLGPHDKEGVGLVQVVKPGEVDLAPVHNVEDSRFEGDPVEDSRRGACRPKCG